jgi:hypothetical protein
MAAFKRIEILVQLSDRKAEDDELWMVYAHGLFSSAGWWENLHFLEVAPTREKALENAAYVERHVRQAHPGAKVEIVELPPRSSIDGEWRAPVRMDGPQAEKRVNVAAKRRFGRSARVQVTTIEGRPGFFVVDRGGSQYVAIATRPQRQGIGGTGVDFEPLLQREHVAENPEKIQAREIWIRRAEGRPGRDDMEPHTFKAGAVSPWEQANAWIHRQARSAPEGGGYDKTDFKITYADGETYEGRFDLEREHAGRHDPLGEHVRTFLQFYAGTYRPPHMAEEKYRAYLDSRKNEKPSAAECQTFLDRYEIGETHDNPAGERKKRLPIPKAQLDWLVGRMHVGESNEHVEAEVRKRTVGEGWTEARVKEAVTYALKQHARNRQMYNDVMRGNFRRNPIEEPEDPGPLAVTSTAGPGSRAELEEAVWAHTHSDFKGVRDDGTRVVLHMVRGEGTCSVPVSSLSEQELRGKLPKRFQPKEEDVGEQFGWAKGVDIVVTRRASALFWVEATAEGPEGPVRIVGGAIYDEEEAMQQAERLAEHIATRPEPPPRVVVWKGKKPVLTVTPER